MLNFASQRNGTRPFTKCWVFIVFMLTTTFSYAADYSVSARQTRSASFTSSGATVDYSLQAKFAANDPRYKTAKVKYSPGKVLQFSNSRKLINPAAAAVNAALAAAVLGAGWAIDELTGQVVGVVPPITGSFYYTVGGSVGYGITPHDACVASGGSHIPYSNYCAPFYSPVISVNCSQHPQASFCSASTQPLSESEWWPLVQDAISSMSPEAQREFWNNVSGLPELTPELQAELDAFNAQIAADTGLNGETKEQSSSDVASDVQDVRVIDPVALDSTGVDSVKPQDTNIKDFFDNLVPPVTQEALPTLPALPSTPPLLQESTCVQLSADILGFGVLEVPGEMGCEAFEIRKDMYGYYMAFITFFLCLGILLKPTANGV